MLLLGGGELLLESSLIGSGRPHGLRLLSRRGGGGCGLGHCGGWKESRHGDSILWKRRKERAGEGRGEENTKARANVLGGQTTPWSVTIVEDTEPVVDEEKKKIGGRTGSESSHIY